MHITFNKLTALRLLRALRAQNGPRTFQPPACDLIAPDSSPKMRWSRGMLSAAAALVENGWSETPLDVGHSYVAKGHERLMVAVPSAQSRIRVKGTISTVYSHGLPPNAFARVADGVDISSPELLFVETAPLMTVSRHVLLGYELCGSFSRDADDPRNGAIAYGRPAVTTKARIAAFIDRCDGIKGTEQARANLAYVEDNAWSPLEAVIATQIVLPVWELGYMLGGPSMGGLTLNDRVYPAGDSHATFTKSSRVPDILLNGTPIGINYDGENHLDLDSIAHAAALAAQCPEDRAAQAALSQAIRSVREKAVDDGRRNRELGSRGLFVIPVTKEDLYRAGRFEALVHLILDSMKSLGAVDVSEQRSWLLNPAMQRKRQEQLWSLLPNGQSAKTLRSE